MQRPLPRKTFRQIHAMQSVGRNIRGPPAGVWKVRKLISHHCWVSTSVKVGSAESLKSSSGKQSQLNPPHSLAGTDPIYRELRPSVEDSKETDPLQDKSIGLYQRFKKTFKQYGKVMVPVHLLTSSVWFGTFYYAAMKGFNVVPFLEHIGFPEKLVNPLRDSQSGYALNAYAMYKIATPARYTVTLGGTSFSVKYLRERGCLPTPPPVKDYLQDKMDETRERLSEKLDETKERFSEKMEETKELLSGRMEETKGKISEKFQETKDKVSFRKKAE